MKIVKLIMPTCTHSYAPPQSSIRHCLSVGYYFRKMVKDGSQGNKGFHWEVIPKKRAALDREIERFMEKKGKAKTDVTAGR